MVSRCQNVSADSVDRSENRHACGWDFTITLLERERSISPIPAMVLRLTQMGTRWRRPRSVADRWYLAPGDSKLAAAVVIQNGALVAVGKKIDAIEEATNFMKIAL
jgi:hypothetical protein